MIIERLHLELTAMLPQVAQLRIGPNRPRATAFRQPTQRSRTETLLDAETFPTVPSLESRWETVEHDQMQFIAALMPNSSQ